MRAVSTCGWIVRVKGKFATCLVLMLTSLRLPADVVVTESSNFSVDVSPVDGRIAMDLEGGIWTLPATGGQASRILGGAFPLARPRWSPDGKRILYQSGTPDGTKLWVADRDGIEAAQVSGPRFHDQDATWHPQGERIVYASDRGDSGLDIWETDLPTGLAWRVTDHPGDETEPVWSATGRHLAYIRKFDGRHTLVLRRHGEAETVLVASATPLSAPSWRPDGSLLTFLRHAGDETTLEMVILSEPVLVRTVSANEQFDGAVTWRDRMLMLYTANGSIRTRGFEDRRSRPLHFRAVVESVTPRAPRTIARKELDVIDPPDGRLIIRGARLFDGIWSRYREDIDVVVEAGRIAALEPRRNWDEGTVLDLGDVTIIPGLIDAWSALPDGAEGGSGLLAYGVTTIVSDAADVPFDPLLWERERLPGPRLLAAASIGPGADVNVEADYFLVRVTIDAAAPANARATADTWRGLGIPVVADSRAAGIRLGADLLLGAASSADSGLYPANATPETEPFTLISGIADARTPGIIALLNSRQAVQLGHASLPARRFGAMPQLATGSLAVVAGSKPNRLAPGLALHAELRALAAAGLNGEQVLHAAGKNVATVLGLSNQIGTIVPGALADLVLVAGDPLGDVDDTLNIVAVVRNGRFFSLVSLLERSGPALHVE